MLVTSDRFFILVAEILFILAVYVPPTARTRGTTIKVSMATCQQHIKAMMIPTNKVEKLEMKWPNYKKLSISVLYNI